MHAMHSVNSVHVLVALEVFPMGNGWPGVVILEDLRFGRAGQVHNLDNLGNLCHSMDGGWVGPPGRHDEKMHIGNAEGYP